MTRITHFKLQPVNVQFWDYYILSHLSAEATIALQRMEYWDGTKDDSNTHAESINDAQIQAGQAPTQDTTYWIYKAQDELHWELMGVAGEKKVPQLVKFLTDTLGYLDCRNNPYKGWDRKKQYSFEAKAIQAHINYLGYIVSYFDLPLKRLRPVFYAIERLTKDKIYIDRISVEHVIAKIDSWQGDENLPHFIKNDLEKFNEIFFRPHLCSFGSFAEWEKAQRPQIQSQDASPFIRQNCDMHSAKSPDAFRNNAPSIPQNCGSNSIEYNTENTNRDDTHRNVTYLSSDATPPSTFASDDAHTHTILQRLEVLEAERNQYREENASLKAQIEQLSTNHTELPTHSGDNSVDGIIKIVFPEEHPTPGNHVAESSKEVIPAVPVEQVNQATSISHSQKSTAPTQSALLEPVERQTRRRNTTGKEKPEKPPKPTQEQIDKVFSVMTETLRKLYKTINPKFVPETFQVVQTKKATEVVKSLIVAQASPALLSLVIIDMWNETDTKGSHWWRGSGRMTVAAICEQYTSRAPGLVSKLPRVVSDDTPEDTAASTVPSYSQQSSRPELQIWKPDVSDDVLSRVWIDPRKAQRQAKIAARGGIHA